MLFTANITENRFITTTRSGDITDPTDKAIDNYKFHQSILWIQKTTPMICLMTNFIWPIFKGFILSCGLYGNVILQLPQCICKCFNLIKRLEHDAFLSTEWFETNSMIKKRRALIFSYLCPFKFRGISMKIFGLKWGMKKFRKVQKKLLVIEIRSILILMIMWFHYVRKREQN